MANCVCEAYSTLAAYHAAVELVDDTKFLSAFVFRDKETGLDQIVLTKKT